MRANSAVVSTTNACSGVENVNDISRACTRTPVIEDKKTVIAKSLGTKVIASGVEVRIDGYRRDRFWNPLLACTTKGTSNLLYRHTARDGGDAAIPRV
jgi:hypothetical protein